jgi:arylformamidase
MTLIDISVPIRQRMPIYEGNPGVLLECVQSIADGATANVSQLDIGVHTGTHVDAPRHFIEGGAGADELPLEPLVGRVYVADGMALDEPVDADALERLCIPPGAERVLLKTPNGSLWERDDFARDFIRLDGSGARFVLDAGIRLIGIDYLSIGDVEAHQVLLGAGVVPLEGVDLRAVEPGWYDLLCLPLKLVGSDGAPARALLRA